ncbi:hypothetical protein FHX03_003087 [Rhizobium sp. BK456]|nr:hypothetical protein [Rhizobium sp. BK456]
MQIHSTSLLDQRPDVLDRRLHQREGIRRGDAAPPDGERAGPAFFGRMKEGVPEIGVVDLADGFRAGSFSGDDIGGQAESDPQDRINAFRIAAEAARQVSAQYVAEKNPGSARHYEELAKTLELQTD